MTFVVIKSCLRYFSSFLVGTEREQYIRMSKIIRATPYKFKYRCVILRNITHVNSRLKSAVLSTSTHEVE